MAEAIQYGLACAALMRQPGLTFLLITLVFLACAIVTGVMLLDDSDGWPPPWGTRLIWLFLAFSTTLNSALAGAYMVVSATRRGYMQLQKEQQESMSSKTRGKKAIP